MDRENRRRDRGRRRTFTEQLTTPQICQSFCRYKAVIVFDPAPAARNPNDKNAFAQVETGSDLIFLFRRQR